MQCNPTLVTLQVQYTGRVTPKFSLLEQRLRAAGHWGYCDAVFATRLSRDTKMRRRKDMVKSSLPQRGICKALASSETQVLACVVWTKRASM